MATLEDLTLGARCRGPGPDRAVSVVQVYCHGTKAVTLAHRDESNGVGNQLLDRDDEVRLKVGAPGALIVSGTEIGRRLGDSHEHVRQPRGCESFGED